MADLTYQESSGSGLELEKLAALFQVVWPGANPIDTAYLQWLYCDNPRGGAIGVNAWSEGEIVGHYAVIPIRAVRNGSGVDAVLSLNTAVHPSQRGRGLFTALANETYAVAKRKGVDHVVGVANANSAPGFISKLGFQLVTPLKARFVTRFPSPVDPARIGAPDWRREWSSDDYRWRLANPRAHYMYHGEGPELTWRARTDVPGIHAIMEEHVPGTLAEALRSQVRRSSFSPLRLWIGLEPRALGVSEPRGFELPKMLRRSPLNLIFRSLGADKAALDPDKVRFTLADFDAF